MKIAIPSKEKSINSEVESRFGRAKGFVIADENKNIIKWIDNEENANSASGAGIQAAQNIINEDADALISMNLGVKSLELLKKYNIELYNLDSETTVENAIDLLKENKLKKI